jgi:hypothetical protein
MFQVRKFFRMFNTPDRVLLARRARVSREMPPRRSRARRGSYASNSREAALDAGNSVNPPAGTTVDSDPPPGRPPSPAAFPPPVPRPAPSLAPAGLQAVAGVAHF